METLLKVKYFPAASLQEFEEMFKEKAEEKKGFTGVENMKYSPDKKRTDITVEEEDKQENTEYGTLIISYEGSAAMSENEVIQVLNSMEEFHAIEVIGTETR